MGVGGASVRLALGWNGSRPSGLVATKHTVLKDLDVARVYVVLPRAAVAPMPRIVFAVICWSVWETCM